MQKVQAARASGQRRSGPRPSPPGGSGVVQEIVTKTQAERNNRENESYFREQPAEQNSRPVNCCATHFPSHLPHVERPAIVTVSDESKPVVKTPHFDRDVALA